MRLVVERAPEGVEETVDQFVGASGLRDDGGVARDSARRVQAHAAQNEVDLVVEVVVQHAMAES
jgi:hypothetical protein